MGHPRSHKFAIKIDKALFTLTCNNQWRINEPSVKINYMQWGAAMLTAYIILRTLFCFRYSADAFIQDARPLQNLVIGSFHNVGSDALCGTLCTSNLSCKSFNFNSKAAVCELIMTDIHLRSHVPGESFSLLRS